MATQCVIGLSPDSYDLFIQVTGRKGTQGPMAPPAPLPPAEAPGGTTPGSRWWRRSHPEPGVVDAESPPAIATGPVSARPRVLILAEAVARGALACHLAPQVDLVDQADHETVDVVITDPVPAARLDDLRRERPGADLLVVVPPSPSGTSAITAAMLNAGADGCAVGPTPVELAAYVKALIRRRPAGRAGF
jgi:hypothetical protein